MSVFIPQRDPEEEQPVAEERATSLLREALGQALIAVQDEVKKQLSVNEDVRTAAPINRGHAIRLSELAVRMMGVEDPLDKVADHVAAVADRSVNGATDAAAEGASESVKAILTSITLELTKEAVLVRLNGHLMAERKDWGGKFIIGESPSDEELRDPSNWRNP